MNIAPIYELKSRLRAVAIAGTNLLSEDFRLKKAVEGFAPLEKASPVFAKIGEMTRNLLADNSPANLLDTITLVDSVITTLGTVEVKGEIENIETFGGGEMIDAPYSRISAVVNALTTKGNGNYNTFKEISENSPELLRDYRVRPALAAGLGASYSELADKVEEVVCGMGSEMLPLLKNGFDPKGKKDMVRRINVIDKIGGSSENEFYLNQLEESEKDVRKLLIYALRHDEKNAEKLIELSKTEKGKSKTAAMTALAIMNNEKAIAFFEEYAKKKPQDALEVLQPATSEWASDLAARIIDKLTINGNGERIKTPDNYIVADMIGKTGAKIERIYREFDGSEVLDGQLGDTIIITNDEGLKRLALELSVNGGYKYAETVARLLGTEDCSEWLENEFHTIKSNINRQVPDDSKVAASLSKIAFENSKIVKALNKVIFENSGYVIGIRNYDYISERKITVKRPVFQPIKGAISDTLIKYPTCEISSILAEWIDLDDKEFCKKLENHFIEQGTTKSHTGGRGVLLNLRKLNVQNVKGLAMKYLKNHPDSDKWDVFGLVNCIFGDDSYKLNEVKEVYEAMRSGKLKTKLTKEEIEDFWNRMEREYG